MDGTNVQSIDELRSTVQSSFQIRLDEDVEAADAVINSLNSALDILVQSTDARTTTWDLMKTNASEIYDDMEPDIKLA